MEDTEPRPSLAGGIVLLVGAVLIVVAVGFLTFGLYSLIRFGLWPHYPASKMLSEIGIGQPNLSWEAGQRALAWLLSQSACIFLFAIGGAVTALGAWIMARHARRQKPAEASA
jgi:ABC-type antimicrobial peptide transport system permease subunit